MRKIQTEILNAYFWKYNSERNNRLNLSKIKSTIMLPTGYDSYSLPCIKMLGDIEFVKAVKNLGFKLNSQHVNSYAHSQNLK